MRLKSLVFHYTLILGKECFCLEGWSTAFWPEKSYEHNHNKGEVAVILSLSSLHKPDFWFMIWAWRKSLIMVHVGVVNQESSTKKAWEEITQDSTPPMKASNWDVFVVSGDAGMSLLCQFWDWTGHVRALLPLTVVNRHLKICSLDLSIYAR